MSVRQDMTIACNTRFVNGHKKCHGEIKVSDQDWNEAADNDADREKKLKDEGLQGCLAGCQCEECSVTLIGRTLSAEYVKTGGPKANTILIADED